MSTGRSIVDSAKRRSIHLAISPCPNDTFIFHALANRKLTLPHADISTVFEDVETLNQAALKETFDISKLSFHTYLLVKDKYHLLRTGAALGYGCGPLLVSRKPVSFQDIDSLHVLVPGALTTAHLLLRLFSPTLRNKQFVRYDEIIPRLLSGEADAGVIIHEDRFVFESKGLVKIVDLGGWWEEETGAPIPLGCVVMKRCLAEVYAAPFDDLVRESIRMARREPVKVLPFIRTHAQQMNADVLDKHIATFVNEHSLDLGEAGERAVAALHHYAERAGILS
jgi:1,4-dihydroxy-6-naphthoate synthase